MKLDFTNYTDMMDAVRELNTQGFKFATDYLNFVLTVNL